jgi:uracil-DNA glycosylase
MDIRLNIDWRNELCNEISELYFEKIISFVKTETLNGKLIFPKFDLIFNAFNQLKYEQIKVVIIGQDPYHGLNQANGLAFSVNDNCKIPPSLKNIFKEINTNYSYFKIPDSGNLEHWANQGVLLLNSVLTVEAHQPTSHGKIGWQKFTDAVIQHISAQNKNLVFLLWGGFAHQKENLINTNEHLVLKTTHPSPFSAHKGFLGCNHFMLTNEYLKSKNIKPIHWIV